jgi:superfamily II DNA or RNA helicase
MPLAGVLFLTIKYRDYQQDLHDRIFASNKKTSCIVSPTGSGKTVLMCGLIQAFGCPTLAIAHRQELVSQMSMTLCRNKLHHSIIAADTTIKNICTKQMQLFNRQFYNPQSKLMVAGVDTLARRKLDLRHVKLWVVDEGHHLIRGNKWGKVISQMPGARGLGFTATPERTDGKGLGSHADGFYDEMLINKKTMAELVIEGSLSKFKIYCPKPSYSTAGVAISATTGDYNPNQLRARAADSKIVGDVVQHYLKLAPGKLGLTFVTDLKTADEVCTAYNAAGVPAAVISSMSTDRDAIVQKFERREYLQLVNVDIFGEGTDLPAIEVISLARPTASYGLHCQQFGRVLRPAPGKEYAIIIDHVDNCRRHGIPTLPHEWTLARRERRGESSGVTEKFTVCPACVHMYQGYSRECPECGHVSVPGARGTAEQVEGELELMDLTLLGDLHKEIARIDEPVGAFKDRVLMATQNPIAAAGAAKKHTERQAAQAKLREAIAVWSAKLLKLGFDKPTRQRIFYRQFGCDVLTAQTYNTKDANALCLKLLTSDLSTHAKN